ncbi:hypothetical protein CALVIDRAFT_303454 [Calocera viscosa TUFC12733]|uniref:Uncharacterized protein n=1 Tax=Calocera viscosa (strain TUFC12733) TaxID=1330018 RepID=A0A167IEY1_CALVF|nr:hypothetical protein CALVIDRAFT_303454 [Calocera viscosa TUFC12733]
MAEWLADKVFCEPEHRVGADEFGLWVLDLGGMVDEASVRLLRKARSKQRKDSVRKSKSRAMRSRDAAVGRDAEDGAEGKERGSPPSSREPSIMKRRKRGARSNKSKNSAANSAASLPLPAAAAAMASVAVQAQTQAQVVRDPEAAQLAEHASAVEALAREASMVNGSISTARSGSRTPSLIPSADEPVPPLPLPMSMPMPTTMPLPMATPVSTAATLRARPSVEDEIWLRGRQPTQAALVLPIRAPIGPSAGASWRAHHSPLNPNPQPNPAYASSVSSFAPSTVSTYNTRLSNGSMRSLSTVATTMSDPTSVKSRWSGLKDPSMRSAGSAGSADFSNPNGLGGKELLREMPASPLGKGARVPRTNVKRIEGLPPEIDDLRTPFKTPTPAQRIVHNESKCVDAARPERFH